MQIVVTVLLKVAKIRSIIGNRIYYNGVEALKGQRHTRVQQRLTLPPSPFPPSFGNLSARSVKCTHCKQLG